MLPPSPNCCGSCNCPINSELNKTKTNFEFYDNNSMINSVVEFTAAVDYIYGISSNDIFDKLCSHSHNDNSLKFCTSCGNFLELCYTAHKNFESTISPKSVLQDIIKHKSEKEFDREDKQLHSIKTISESIEPLVDGFSDSNLLCNYDEFSDEPDEQIDIKYGPLDSSLETSNSIDDIKSRLRNRKVVIKLERLSEESIPASKLKDGAKADPWKKKRTSTNKLDSSKLKKSMNGRLRKAAAKKTDVNVKKSKKQWKCRTCQKVFTDYSDYKYKHLPIHKHDKKLGNLCHLCDRRCRDRYDLKRHYLRLHAPESEKLENKVECQICGKLVFSPNMKTHVKTHGPKPTYKCEQCDKEYTSKQQLKEHTVRVHTDSTFPCDVCGKQLSSPLSLQAHLKIFHQPKQFACDQCPLTFPLNCYLRRHKDTIHSEPSLVCDECGKTFKYSQHFASHMKVHREIAENGAGSLQCDECGKYFKHSLSLRKHKGRIHREKSNGKIYKCSFCGKMLSGTFRLRIHEDLHRKDSNYKPRKYRKGQRMPSMANEQPLDTTGEY